MKTTKRATSSQAFAVFFVLSCFSLAALADSNKKEIFLPPDCDVITISGNGFKLELTQFQLAKQNWQQAAQEAAQVDGPRSPDTEEQKPVVNENLYSDIKQLESSKQMDYGLIGEPLIRWIKSRATSLLNRVERYDDEIKSFGDVREQQVGNRIVVEVLLLNVLTDLDNLVKENLSSLKWLKNKLNTVQKRIPRVEHQNDIFYFVRRLIETNKIIESKLRGTNNPGKEWVKNTQSIKRVLHEQRFSKSLSEQIIAYLGGQFNLMSRSSVYQTNIPPKRLEDGLYYLGAKSLVSANFPFASQDAIANGAYV